VASAVIITLLALVTAWTAYSAVGSSR